MCLQKLMNIHHCVFKILEKKKKKCHGWTHGRSDNVKTVYPTTKFAGVWKENLPICHFKWITCMPGLFEQTFVPPSQRSSKTVFDDMSWKRLIQTLYCFCSSVRKDITSVSKHTSSCKNRVKREGCDKYTLKRTQSIPLIASLINCRLHIKKISLVLKTGNDFEYYLVLVNRYGQKFVLSFTVIIICIIYI